MLTEQYEDLRSRAEERLSGLGEYVNRGSEQLSEMVEDQPARALLFSCLAGFAVGLLISRAIVSDDRYSSSFDTSSAERFGRNMLDKIEQLMPTMLRERLS